MGVVSVENLNLCKSPNRPRRLDENECAAALLLVTSLIQRDDEVARGEAPEIAGLAEALPAFWLALARGAAALAAQGRDAEAEGVSADLARRWLQRALRHSFTFETLHAAAKILLELGEAEILRQMDGEDQEEDEAAVPGVLVEAADYLGMAARLSPARPDILMDGSQALLLRATTESTGAVSLLHEALRCSDAALGCYGEADRRVAETGKLHPMYVQTLSASGTR